MISFISHYADKNLYLTHFRTRARLLLFFLQGAGNFRKMISRDRAALAREVMTSIRLNDHLFDLKFDYARSKSLPD